MQLETLLNDMAELEIENSFRISRNEKELQKEKLLTLFNKDHQSFDNIIYHYEKKSLVAFFRYTLTNAKIRICSIQLKNKKEIYLRNLMTQTLIKFDTLSFNKVESEVYKKNSESLILHLKLRFQYKSNMGRKIKLLCPKNTFLISVKSYLDSTTPNIGIANSVAGHWSNQQR